MIKNNKKQLILSSIVILLPMLVGLLIWKKLPDTMTTHWAADGATNGWSSKVFAIFALPIIMLVIQWLCIILTTLDPKSKEQSKKISSMVYWIVPILSVIISTYMYSFALGVAIGSDILIRIPMGLIFLIFGNFMPKCKQNRTIGIKVPWTLKNEENWNKTHRFAGKLWVAGGLLIIMTIVIPMKYMVYMFLPVILILAFVPMIYSYVYYRKQLQIGTATKADTIREPGEKKTTTVAAAICIVILIAVILLLFTGDFKVAYEDTFFSVNTAFWEDASVSYTDIDSIEYREQDTPGERTFGYGSFTLLMGEFKNDEFGDYTRYSYTSCDSCVVLSIDGETFVLNGEDEEATKAIYDELTKRQTDNQ